MRKQFAKGQAGEANWPRDLRCGLATRPRKRARLLVLRGVFQLGALANRSETTRCSLCQR